MRRVFFKQTLRSFHRFRKATKTKMKSVEVLNDESALKIDLEDDEACDIEDLDEDIKKIGTTQGP
mgnify:CR=1 FL=1